MFGSTGIESPFGKIVIRIGDLNDKLREIYGNLAIRTLLSAKQ